MRLNGIAADKSHHVIVAVDIHYRKDKILFSCETEFGKFWVINFAGRQDRHLLNDLFSSLLILYIEVGHFRLNFYH